MEERNYVISFIREEETIKTNRFKKFLKQFRANLLCILNTNIHASFNNLNSLIYDELKFYYDIKSGFYKELNEFIYEDEEPNEYISEELLMNEYMVNNPIVTLNSAGLVNEPNFVNYDAEEMGELLDENQTELYKIIDNVAQQVIIDYLAYQIALDDDITEFNYAKELIPDDYDTYYLLFNQIFDKSCYEFEKYLFTLEHYEPKAKNTDEKLLKENKELKQTIEKMEEKMNEKSIINRSLNQKIEILEKDTQKKIKISNEDLTKKIAMLNKQIKSLEEDNEKLLKKIQKEEIIEEKKEDTCEEKPEINFDALRLLFVTTDYMPFVKELETTFKNCKVLYKNYEASYNYSNYDYVIVCTSHMKHAIYYGIKENCKNANTKLLHCSNSNIEKIKELITEQELAK